MRGTGVIYLYSTLTVLSGPNTSLNQWMLILCLPMLPQVTSRHVPESQTCAGALRLHMKGHLGVEENVVKVRRVVVASVVAAIIVNLTVAPLLHWLPQE